MKILFEFSLITIFIILILLSIYGLVFNKPGYILFSYLAVAFKTNILSEAGVEYFEPQYIIAVIWLTAILFHKRPFLREKNRKAENYLLILMIVLSLFPYLQRLKQYFIFGYNELYTFKHIIKIFLELLLFYSLVRYRNILNIKSSAFEYGILIGSFIVGFQSIFSYFIIGYVGISGFENHDVARVGGYMKYDVNELTLIINSTVMYIFFLISRNRISKIIGYTVVLTGFVAILLTGSRTGLAASILVFVLYNLNLSTSKNVTKLIPQIFIASFIAILGFILLNTYGTTTLSRIESEKINENVRFIRWLEYFNYYAEYPAAIFTGMYEEIKSTMSYRRALHNIYLQVLVEFGIVVLALFLNFMLSTYKQLDKTSKLFIILFLFYGITLSNPPISYIPFIILYFLNYSSSYHFNRNQFNVQKNLSLSYGERPALSPH